MTDRYTKRGFFRSLALSLLPFALLAGCSSAPVKKEVIEHSAFLLAPDPKLSPEEWDLKALALAQTGGPKMVELICAEDKKAYACNFLAASCQKGGKADCRALAMMGYQDERYKYRRFACDFGDGESCQILKGLKLKNQRGLASEKPAQDINGDPISTASMLDNWNNGSIDRYIEVNRVAPTEIIPLENGTTIYEFIDGRGASANVGTLVALKCTIQLFVENGRIFTWKLRGNVGSCLT